MSRVTEILASIPARDFATAAAATLALWIVAAALSIILP